MNTIKGINANNPGEHDYLMNEHNKRNKLLFKGKIINNNKIFLRYRLRN